MREVESKVWGVTVNEVCTIEMNIRVQQNLQ